MKSCKRLEPTYAIVTAAAVILMVWIVTLPLSAYLHHLNIDDSFYYLVIARNFSQGQFSTFDGLGLTNGYHPLWAMMLVPVFWLAADPSEILRLTKLLEITILLVSCLTIVSAGRRAGWSHAMVLIPPLVIFSSPVLYQGMETSIQVLLLAMLMSEFVRLGASRPNAPQVARVGLICALLPWARLEDLTISLMTTAVLARAMIRSRHGWLMVATLIVLVTGSVVGYATYNLRVFGTATPVSGQIKIYWSAARLHHLGQWRYIKNADSYIRLHHRLLMIVAFLATVVFLTRPRSPNVQAQIVAYVRTYVAILLAAYIARLVFGIVFIDPVFDNEYYYMPAIVAEAIALPVIVSCCVESRACQWLGARPPLPVLRGLGEVTLLAMVAWQAHPWRLASHWREAPREANWQDASFDGARWINANLPRGAIVGSVDAGVVGYFARNRVVNLDGLVNSTAYFAAMKDQAVEGWMRRTGVGYLANGVRTDPADGCAFMAAGAVQHRPFSGCELVHQGMSFTNAWSGRRERMQFRVYALAPSAVAGALASASATDPRIINPSR